MVVLRLLLVLAVVAIGASVVMFVVTRNPRYLAFAKTLGKIVIVVALTFFALLIVERLAIL